MGDERLHPEVCLCSGLNKHTQLVVNEGKMGFTANML